MTRLKRRARNSVILVTALVLLIGLPWWSVSREEQRQERDQELIYAAQLGRDDDILTLLRQGADPNARDQPSEVQQGLWSWLLSHLHSGSSEASSLRATALLCAIRSPHPFPCARLLIQSGANMNANNGMEGTMVFWAARGGDGDTLRLLLNKGARVSGRDGFGFSDIAGAHLANRPDLVRVLKEAGAKE